MPDFSQRSKIKELIDGPVPKPVFHRNLHELDLYNRISGGHAISLQGVKKLLQTRDKTYHLADLGCGSGDVLKYIALWARKHKFRIRMTGVDNNVDAIDYLKKNCAHFPEISGVAMDYRRYLKDSPNVDIIHSALFCHHLSDQELIDFIGSSLQKTRRGLVINDLVRNPFAYYAVKYMTRIMNGSYLSQNDGPVSVLKGFREVELHALLSASMVKKYRIFRMHGFRFLVVAYADI